MREDAIEGPSTGEETLVAGGRGAVGCVVGAGAKGSFVRSG